MKRIIIYIVMILIVSFCESYSQNHPKIDEVIFEPGLESELNKRWENFISDLDSNSVPYIITDETKKSIYTQNDKYTYYIRIVHSGKVNTLGYGITKIKTNIKEFDESEILKLSKVVDDLVFQMMLEHKWEEFMSFEPPHKDGDIIIFSIEYLTAESFQQVMKIIK